MVREVTNLPYVVPRKVKGRKEGQTYTYYYFERAGGRDRLPDPTKDENAFLEAYRGFLLGDKRSSRKMQKFTYSALILHYKKFSVTPEGSKRKKGYSDLKPRTKKDYDAVFDYMARNVGDLDFRLTVRSDIKEAMRQNMHRRKFANDLKSCWSILHEHAIDEGWRETNAASGISKFKTGEGHVAWPVEVQRKFWNAAGDFGELGYHVRLAMILYIDSAQRGGDVLDYRWSDIEGDGLTIVQNKTQTEVYIPFTDWMRDALRVERNRQISKGKMPEPPNDFILQNDRGGKLSYNTLNGRFVKIRKAAGIDAKYKLHGFRYTAASELGAAVGRAGASVTGHLTEEMFDKYAGVSMRKAQAIKAQGKRNKNRTKRETLKTILKT